MSQFGQAQLGYLQQLGYCSQTHYSDDPLEHAKQRLAALKSNLAKVAEWQAEADKLERMIEAAK
jgi:hypothetical protein